MEQKEIMEQVFKDAFKDFTPDVSPKVWSGISTQLAQPVIPSANPTGSLLKMAATKLSTVSTWIIGGIAATAIIACVLLYEHKSNTYNEVVTSQQTAVTAPLISNQKVDVTASPAIENKEPINNRLQKNEPVVKSNYIDNAVADEKADEHNSSTTYQNNNSNINKQVATQTPTISNPVVNQNENQNSNDHPKASENNNANNNANVDQSSPLILINTTAGFAPLQVAGLLNKEELKADWDFGDGSSQLNSNSVTHNYMKPGTYTLQCNSGETKLAKTIEVIGTINTAFSPNGDGINDYFFVDATNLKTFSLRIFDRNGRKMTTLNNTEEKWDGRLSNGETALAGTYFYELTAVTDNGKEIKQRGVINLFR